ALWREDGRGAGRRGAARALRRHGPRPRALQRLARGVFRREPEVRVRLWSPCNDDEAREQRQPPRYLLGVSAVIRNQRHHARMLAVGAGLGFCGFGGHCTTVVTAAISLFRGVIADVETMMSASATLTER